MTTPFTYDIDNFLKHNEQKDYYDRTTNFNRFSL
jgi:hypothetical protein